MIIEKTTPYRETNTLFLHVPIRESRSWPDSTPTLSNSFKILLLNNMGELIWASKSISSLEKDSKDFLLKVDIPKPFNLPAYRLVCKYYYGALLHKVGGEQSMEHVGLECIGRG